MLLLPWKPVLVHVSVNLLIILIIIVHDISPQVALSRSYSHQPILKAAGAGVNFYCPCKTVMTDIAFLIVRHLYGKKHQNFRPYRQLEP